MTEHLKSNILNHLYNLKQMGFEYIEPFEYKNDISNDMILPNTLIELEQTVLNCTLCSFSKTKNNILFGSGNEAANIVFLGMYPNLIEDKDGHFLLGKTGEMLKSMCENVLKQSINDIFTLNILKCLPLNNDKIENECITCKPYALKQIEIIKPSIIVAFGESYKYLTSDKREFNDIVGIIQNFNNIQIMPTYDPSYILRNPSYKKDVLHHLQEVKKRMDTNDIYN